MVEAYNGSGRNAFLNRIFRNDIHVLQSVFAVVKFPLGNLHFSAIVPKLWQCALVYVNLITHLLARKCDLQTSGHQNTSTQRGQCPAAEWALNGHFGPLCAPTRALEGRILLSYSRPGAALQRCSYSRRGRCAKRARQRSAECANIMQSEAPALAAGSEGVAERVVYPGAAQRGSTIE